VVENAKRRQLYPTFPLAPETAETKQPKWYQL